jgi:hypothetical protein
MSSWAMATIPTISPTDVKESGLGAVHSDATPSTAVHATYRGPVRDGLA